MMARALKPCSISCTWPLRSGCTMSRGAITVRSSRWSPARRSCCLPHRPEATTAGRVPSRRRWRSIRGWTRSEERRVGKECRCAWWGEHSSRRRHTRWPRDWSSDVCSSDLLFDLLYLAPTQRVYHVQGSHHGKIFSLVTGEAIVLLTAQTRSDNSGKGSVETQMAVYSRLDKIGRASCRERV